MSVDPIASAFMDALNASIEREWAEEKAVREEIARKGTWWAAKEIWELRRALASARARQSALTDR